MRIGTVTGIQYQLGEKIVTLPYPKVFKRPEASENITEPYTVISTGYCYYPYSLTTSISAEGECKGISKNSNAYKLLFMDSENTQGGGYWLASSYVLANNGGAEFGLCCVLNGGMYRSILWDTGSGAIIDDFFEGYSDTDCNVESNTHGIRAVVSLNYDVKLVSTDNSNEWNIEG